MRYAVKLTDALWFIKGDESMSTNAKVTTALLSAAMCSSPMSFAAFYIAEAMRKADQTRAEIALIRAQT